MNNKRVMTERIEALKVFFPAKKINIKLVGCGGTGSWLAPHVARLSRLMIDTGKDVNIAFCDKDIVEEKNLYRQNFCPADVGRNKAEALAYRFSLTWGVQIKAEGDFTGGYSSDPTLYLGCVDNAHARRAISDSVSNRNTANWWIDCGNARTTGQVFFGGGIQDNHVRKIAPEGFTTWVPLPDQQCPQLRDNEPVDLEQNSTNLSCAEMAMQSAQGLSINQMMATIAADYLKCLLLTHDLDRMATYVSLEAGTMTSVYTAPCNLRIKRRRTKK